MILYQAPLEGISGYIYRNAINDIFGGVDKYFAPFICPYEKRIITDKEIRQLKPQNNRNIKLVPQIMTTDAKAFKELTKRLHEDFGYEEFDLNMGCPSQTVVSKGRGAGFLADPLKLDDFLQDIFEDNSFKISVKTRLGMKDKEEFIKLLEIYNKYPLCELIVHPRVREEFYKGEPHYDSFEYALNNSRNRLVYNGNIGPCAAEIHKNGPLQGILERAVKEEMPLMIGRGMVANPAIYRQLKGGAAASKEELRAFLNRLKEDYSEAFYGEKPVLYKLKETWAFMGPYYEQYYELPHKLCKKVMKAGRISEYNAIENEIFTVLDL